MQRMDWRIGGGEHVYASLTEGGTPRQPGSVSVQEAREIRGEVRWSAGSLGREPERTDRVNKAGDWPGAWSAAFRCARPCRRAWRTTMTALPGDYDADPQRFLANAEWPHAVRRSTVGE